MECRSDGGKRRPMSNPWQHPCMAISVEDYVAGVRSRVPEARALVERLAENHDEKGLVWQLSDEEEVLESLTAAVALVRAGHLRDPVACICGQSWGGLLA